MDILLEPLNKQAGCDVDLSLWAVDESVIDVTNLTSEDLSKTSQFDLESLNNPPIESDQLLMATSDEINAIAKELIEDVIASSHVSTTNSGHESASKGCLIDISDFTAKEYFDTKRFNLENEFKDTGSLDLKLVKMPAQVEQGQKLIVFESATVTPVKVPLPKISPPKNRPQIERRMPKFNKLTKFVSELRDFEAQLVNVSIVQIDAKARLGRKRKQNFKSVNNDLEISFYSDDDESLASLNEKKPRKASLKCKKVVPEVDQDDIDSEDSTCQATHVSPISISVKPLALKYEPDEDVDNSDQDREMTKHASLCCNYCQKMFLTVAGLNTHMTNCPKLTSKLSEIIEEGCAFTGNQAFSKNCDENMPHQHSGEKK